MAVQDADTTDGGSSLSDSELSIGSGGAHGAGAHKPNNKTCDMGPRPIGLIPRGPAAGANGNFDGGHGGHGKSCEHTRGLVGRRGASRSGAEHRDVANAATIPQDGRHARAAQAKVVKKPGQEQVSDLRSKLRCKGEEVMAEALPCQLPWPTKLTYDSSFADEDTAYTDGAWRSYDSPPMSVPFSKQRMASWADSAPFPDFEPYEYEPGNMRRPHGAMPPELEGISADTNGPCSITGFDPGLPVKKRVSSFLLEEPVNLIAVPHYWEGSCYWF